MSLSELFKPRLRSCGACAAPWPNVALVLQYLQALRVSSDTFKLKKRKKTKKRNSATFLELLSGNADSRVRIHDQRSVNGCSGRGPCDRFFNQDFRIEFR